MIRREWSCFVREREGRFEFERRWSMRCFISARASMASSRLYTCFIGHVHCTYREILIIKSHYISN